jgi:CHASE3 domain sensor protein
VAIVVSGEHEDHEAAAAAAGATQVVPPDQAEHVAHEIVDALEEARGERELHEAVAQAQDQSERALEASFAAASHGHVELEGRLDGIESRLSEMLDKLATLHPVEAAGEAGEAVQEAVALPVEAVSETVGGEPEPEHRNSSPRREQRRRGLKRGRR